MKELDPIKFEHYYDIAIAKLPRFDLQGRELQSLVREFVTNNSTEIKPKDLKSFKEHWSKYSDKTNLEKGTEWMVD